MQHYSAPRISLLSDHDIERVHASSLRLLETAGVQIDDPAHADLLARAGANALGNGRFGLPASLVRQAMETVPHELSVSDRRGAFRFTLSGGEGAETKFGIGVTNLHYQDPATDDVSPFLLRHMAESARLAQALTSYDLVSTIGCPSDVTEDRSDLLGTLELVANTDKPLVLLTASGESFEPVLKMLRRLAPWEDWAPWALTYVNPTTPLRIGAETSGKIAAAADMGLPVIFSSYGMAGATTPVDPAGSLALLHAELLAGLTLCQLVKPGMSVVLGAMPAAFDMAEMCSVYTPHTYLLNLACAEMMAFFGIPHCGTSGCGVGAGCDLAAAGHLWINHLTSCLGRCCLVPFVGGSFDSLVFSPMLAVLGDLVIAECRTMAGGIVLDGIDAVDAQVAQAIDEGGFLGLDETARRFREYAPDRRIWAPATLDKWLRPGRRSAESQLKERTLDLIAHAAPPEDHEEIRRKGLEFIQGL